MVSPIRSARPVARWASKPRYSSATAITPPAFATYSGAWRMPRSASTW